MGAVFSCVRCYWAGRIEFECYEKPLRDGSGFSFSLLVGSLVHSAHTTTHTSGGVGVFFWNFDDESAHGDGGRGDRYRVLDGFTGDFYGVDNTGFFDIDDAFFWGHDVDALPWLTRLDLREEGLGVEAGVLHDVDEWGFKGVFQDLFAGADTVGAVGFDFGREVDESHTAARDDSLGEGGFCGGYGVVDAEFLFVDFGFGGAADLDDCNFAL